MTGFITSDGADYLMSLYAGIAEPPDSYFLALVTEPVGATESGAELVEPAFSDYYRAEMFTGPENWVVAYGSATNSTEVALPVPGTDTWVGIVGWALCDSFTEGKILYAGDLDPFDIPPGEQAFLPPGSLTLGINLDGWREQL